MFCLAKPIGKVFDAQSDYILDQTEKVKKVRLPDISFLSFKNLVGKMHNQGGFIIAKPFFIIELPERK